MKRNSPLQSVARLASYPLWTGLPGVLLLACIAVVVVLYQNDLLLPAHWYSLLDDDQARSALVARSLAQGLGYKSPLLNDAMIEFYRNANQLNVGGLWENSDRFPLTIFAIFLLFKLFGTTSYVLGILGFGIIFFLASMALIHRLATWVTGNPLAGLLAVGAVCLYTTVTNSIFYKGADDIFYTLLALYAYCAWRPKIYGGDIIRSAALGVFIGLTFLCRENLGLYFIAGIAADALLSLKRRELKFRAVLRGGAPMGLAFGAAILPFGWYTYKMWGVPFFSANSLYQFSLYTPYQMTTDSWWKLHTPVGHICNLALLASDPFPFLKNWADFIRLNIGELAPAFGLEWLLAACGIYLRWRQGMLARVQPFLLCAAVPFALNLLTLGFFTTAGYSPDYIVTVMPPLDIAAVDGAFRLTVALQAFLQRVAARLRALDRLFATGLVRDGIFLAMGALAVLILIYKHYTSFLLTVFPLTRIQHLLGDFMRLGAIMCGVLVCVLLIVQIALFTRRRTAQFPIWLFVVFLVASFIEPNRNIKESAYLSLPKRTPSLDKLRDATGPDGIVLAFNGFYGLPWLIDRKALGLPEYPDYIYELIAKYNLPIDTIYLDGAMPWFIASNAHNWAPSYEIYPILNRIKGVIPGFELIDYRVDAEGYPRFGLPTVPKEIAVYRRIPGFDFSTVTAPPESYVADNAADRIHFVSGFGEVGTFDGKPVIFASNDVRARYKKRPNGWEPWADNDITFHATAARKPKAIVIDAYMLGRTQLSAYLNLDLDIYDKPAERDGKRVGDLYIPAGGWREIRIHLPPEQVKDGLNKIGFKSAYFNPVPVCPADPAMRAASDLDLTKCFDIQGLALPSGILAGQLPELMLSDFGALQRKVDQADGVMLVHKVTFEY